MNTTDIPVRETTADDIVSCPISLGWQVQMARWNNYRKKTEWVAPYIYKDVNGKRRKSRPTPTFTRGWSQFEAITRAIEIAAEHPEMELRVSEYRISGFAF